MICMLIVKVAWITKSLQQCTGNWKTQQIFTYLHHGLIVDLHVTTITVISVISRISSTGRDSQLVIYLVYLLKTALHVPFLKADRQKNDNLCWNMYRKRSRKQEALERALEYAKKYHMRTENNNHLDRPDPPVQHDTSHNDPFSTTSTPSIQLGLTYRSIRIGSYKILKSQEMVSFCLWFLKLNLFFIVFVLI